ncbi:MAG: TadE/TadG family type IV pilus assembly protein [Novosphingobium sp.]
MTRPGTLLRDQGGATAAEFALVLPIALLFLLGIVDVGRFAWNLNQMEKGIHMGARFAVATDVVPGGLIAKDYTNTSCSGLPLTAGDTICQSALGTISCTNTSCTCATSPCPGTLTPYDTLAFGRIANRVRVFAPFVGPDKVTVQYSGSGIGFVGDPGPGPDIAPIVTIKISGVPFAAMSLLGWKLHLPTVSYSQTLEDGTGTLAY